MVNNNKKIYLLILSFLLLVACSDVVRRGTDLSWSEGTIVFHSERHVRHQRGIDIGLGRLFIAKEDGSQVSYLKELYPVLGFPVAWSPDGNTMAVVTFDEEADSFCITLVNANDRRCLVIDGYAPSWSPDGDWIAYYRPQTSLHPADLSIINVHSSEVKRLVELSKELTYSNSTWSPDGKWLAYDAPEGDGKAIYLIAVAGGEPRRLQAGKMPAWSPQGDEIAFVRFDDIWIYELSSGEEILLVDDPVKALWPSWSSNGQSLVFQSHRDGNGDIYRVNRDGSALTNLIHHPEFDGVPSWRPSLQKRD